MKRDVNRIAKIKRIWFIMNATNRAAIDDGFQSPFILTDEELEGVLQICLKREKGYGDDKRFVYKEFEGEFSKQRLRDRIRLAVGRFRRFVAGY